MKGFVLVLSVAICCMTSVQAQLGFCTGNTGDPIFTEDFGAGLTNGLHSGRWAGIQRAFHTEALKENRRTDYFAIFTRESSALWLSTSSVTKDAG